MAQDPSNVCKETEKNAGTVFFARTLTICNLILNPAQYSTVYKSRP